ncbi:ABC transporter permease [Stenotrophomonas sp. MMGLT7]|uniref:ABC transporter permease n=1 Tax=Stenotrophomonas sp. MMGLT7 TaxID=2901227 RepID=UPI001E3A0C22|nr:ABC transporter permease [Stenotrophomonas sp. MMGLT7]MCD7099222.1 ABC transporter permease [Stenotrophomonas sp. MMGLT7]
MLGYYFHLALRSFRRNKVLTALMVLAIALGIGASMTTLTVFHVLSGDPIPGKSGRLFHVQLDPQPLQGHQPGEEPTELLTRFDAQELLRERHALRQTQTNGGVVTVEPDDSAVKPFRIASRNVTADFFPMFETPFVHGRGWSADDDEARARVVVIGKKLNDQLFGGADSSGRTLRIDGYDFRVVGVLADWKPTPKFFDFSGGRFASNEQVYEPFSVARELGQSHNGSVNCYKVASDQMALNAPCTWIHYWVELESAAQAADFKAYLDNYSARQRDAGRFERPPNTRLRDVMQWLDHKRVVPGDVRLQLWFSLGLLLVCLVNTVGLLLAKFLRRSGEIGVRRALGASRGAIFRQCLVEAGTIGLAGGALGLGLAALGLWAIRNRPAEYAHLARLDGSMLVLTFVLALAASLLAGLLPAWRAMRVAPALQLKSQ